MSTPASLAAHEDVKPRKGKQWERIVLELEAAGPLTCDEISAGLSMSPSSTTARLSELRKKGVIEPSGEERLTRWGKMATAWRLRQGNSEAEA